MNQPRETVIGRLLATRSRFNCREDRFERRPRFSNDARTPPMSSRIGSEGGSPPPVSRARSCTPGSPITTSSMSRTNGPTNRWSPTMRRAIGPRPRPGSNAGISRIPPQVAHLIRTSKMVSGETFSRSRAPHEAHVTSVPARVPRKTGRPGASVSSGKPVWRPRACTSNIRSGNPRLSHRRMRESSLARGTPTVYAQRSACAGAAVSKVAALVAPVSCSVRAGARRPGSRCRVGSAAV